METDSKRLRPEAEDLPSDTDSFDNVDATQLDGYQIATVGRTPPGTPTGVDEEELDVNKMFAMFKEALVGQKCISNIIVLKKLDLTEKLKE